MGDENANVELKAPAFRVFIRYARENHNIATAVKDAIQNATGPAAFVFMDVALPMGVSFEKEIKNRLDETNIFVVVLSEILKPKSGPTVWERGYFPRAMEGEARADFPRRIAPIYLEKPPDS